MFRYTYSKSEVDFGGFRLWPFGDEFRGWDPPLRWANQNPMPLLHFIRYISKMDMVTILIKNDQNYILKMLARRGVPHWGSARERPLSLRGVSFLKTRWRKPIIFSTPL